jgi:hypothetical protein
VANGKGGATLVGSYADEVKDPGDNHLDDRLHSNGCLLAEALYSSSISRSLGWGIGSGNRGAAMGSGDLNAMSRSIDVR